MMLYVMGFHGVIVCLVLLWTGTRGCDHGLYGTHCNKTCSTTCKTNICSPNGICRDCRHGYYGIRCNHRCPGTCIEGECYRYDVSCVQGCKTGWYGRKCQHQCQNCTVACHRVTGTCLLASPGIALKQFVAGPNKCGEASMLEGRCMDGCQGDSCDTPCPSPCLQCGRYGANCSSCVAGRHGERCDQTCPVSCPVTCDIYGDCVTSPSGEYVPLVGNNQINIHTDCGRMFIMTAVGVFRLLLTWAI